MPLRVGIFAATSSGKNLIYKMPFKCHICPGKSVYDGGADGVNMVFDGELV